MDVYAARRRQGESQPLSRSNKPRMDKLMRSYPHQDRCISHCPRVAQRDTRSKQARRETRKPSQASNRNKGANKVQRREEGGEKQEEPAETKRSSGMQHPLSVDNTASHSR